MRTDPGTNFDSDARSAFLQLAEEAAAKAVAKFGFPRRWLTEREAETYLRMGRLVLAANRAQGKPVPRSYGHGKLRRYDIADLDTFITGSE